MLFALRRSIVRASLPLLALVPAAAHAQNNTNLITPALPPGFDKGRNISVADRSRPDFDALGIPVGSFYLFPKVQTGVGFSSNVLLNADNKKSDAFAVVAPEVRLQSDWSLHQLSLRAGLEATRYASVTSRNQTEFVVDARGRYDFAEGISASGQASVQRLFETPFSGAIPSDLSNLSSYVLGYGAVRGEYRMGQFRGLLSGDYSHYKFGNVDRLGGALNQRERDRDIWRGTAQGEFALTPSTSIFARAGYDQTRYDEFLSTGLRNRDSDGYRISAGANLDLSGLLRGTVSIGYVKRNFISPQFNDVSGLTAEARIEYFPSELTTFTLEASRSVQDANISNLNAFFDNQVSLRADHELLRNLILNAVVEVSRQDYLQSDSLNKIMRASAGARYLATPRYGLEGSASYTDRSTRGSAIGRDFDDFRVILTFVFHP